MTSEPRSVESKLVEAGVPSLQAQQVENIRLAAEVKKDLSSGIDDLEHWLQENVRRSSELKIKVDEKWDEYKSKKELMAEAGDSLEINHSMIEEAHRLLGEDDRLTAETQKELDELPKNLVKELEKIEADKVARLAKSRMERMDKRRELKTGTDEDFDKLLESSGDYKSELVLIAKLGELSGDSRLNPAMSAAMERVGASGGLGGLVDDLKGRTESMASKRGELARKLRQERIELDAEAKNDEEVANSEAKRLGDEARAEYVRMQNVLADRLKLYDNRRAEHQKLLDEVSSKSSGLEQALQVKMAEADGVREEFRRLSYDKYDLGLLVENQRKTVEQFVGALEKNEANLVAEAGGVLRAAEFVVNDLSEDLESRRAIALSEIDDAESEAIRLLSEDEDRKIKDATENLRRREKDTTDGLVETGLYIKGENGEPEMKAVKGYDMIISERKRRSEADAIIDSLIIAREEADETIENARMTFVDEVVRVDELRDERVKVLDQGISVQRAQLNSAGAALEALKEIIPSIPDSVDKGGGILKATLRVLNGLFSNAKKVIS